jgi:hypothetical protein
MDTKISQFKDQNYYYKLETLPHFPANLFRFKEYNGIKLASAFLLLISLIFFLISFISLLSNNYSVSPLQVRSWYEPLIALLKSFTSIFSAIASIFTLVIISTPVVLSFLLAWVIFDPRNVANFALGFTNCLVGILVILNPVDTIPDFIPVVGTLDDAFFSSGFFLSGAFILFQAGRNRDKIDGIIQLMNEHNEETALQLLIEDKGVKIKKVSKSTNDAESS